MELFGDPGDPFFSFEAPEGSQGWSQGGPGGETVFKMAPLGASRGALGPKKLLFWGAGIEA